ncbi:Major facilitator superfamily protein [Rhynchospora pubera]|uniref:Major facilitator superfamily protein n=1 Tax=Rhynchospora pubera TaxID=906938 RepID=A0AAV8C639_9POAL|nr:Major facilitator superfamily protein [Rhynchospora pubera]
MSSSSSSSSLHWLSLVGTIWLQAINGPNSDFAIYSSQLKDVKHISQVQLNFLAFASDAGKLFGWFSGVAAIYLPLWLVAVTGAAFSLVGYGVQFLFLENSKLEYWHLFILTSLAGNGICWINTVCYLICIRNFTSDSRVAVGISTSYLGLSAKVYNVIANAVFTKTESIAKSYLLLNAIVPMIVTIFVTPSLRVLKATKERTNSAFLFMFGITLATGICAIFGSIGTKSYGFSSKEHMISLGVLLVSPLFVPVGISLSETMRKILRDKKENRIHDLRIEDIESAKETKEEREEELVVPISIPVSAQVVEEKECEEVGGMKMLKKVDFWLYFMSYMFSGTLGLVFLNNLGQIAESRGLSDTSTLVSLSSSFGFFGRLIPSFLDYFSIKRGFCISRIASMAALMAPSAGAFFLLLHPSSSILFISTAIIGACTGAITSFAVSATSELFGTKNFGVNHNIVVANIPIGSFCFGYFAAFFYQKEAQGNYKCFGSRCYATSYVIWGCTCTIGTVLCTVLYVRSRNLRRKSLSN